MRKSQEIILENVRARTGRRRLAPGRGASQPSLLPLRFTLNVNFDAAAASGLREGARDGGAAKASLAQSPHLRPIWHIFPHLTALHSHPPRVKRDGQLVRARSFSCGYHSFSDFVFVLVFYPEITLAAIASSSKGNFKAKLRKRPRQSNRYFF